MHHSIRPTAWITVALVLTLFSMRGALADDRLQIYTVNYPLAYFAERIAGDLAEVTFPAPPDVDPAFWMPGAETIAAYQGADLILLNGADYAKWADKVSLPRSRMVETSRAFRDAYIRAPDGVSHSHGPVGEHTHGGVAFTTWLDLDQAVQQAAAVADAVSREHPDAGERIDENLDALKGELMALDQRIMEIIQADPSRPLLASHPVYQYLARRYGLNLRSVMWEPDEVPSDAEWAALEEILRTHPAKWMIWEGEPADETSLRLRSLGLESVVVNPCANRPASGDFRAVMSRNATNLERVFR
jgi:zinc transport system substrate-binding protein